MMMMMIMIMLIDVAHDAALQSGNIQERYGWLDVMKCILSSSGF
jgi:hypothetical protein